jgi:SHS2 domain-containing protein
VKLAHDFELLDHPADIGFRARGKTLEELFANCAHALIWIILDPARIEPVLQISISATGGDYESLLVNWLNEVLYYTDSKRIAIGEFRFLALDETRIECTASGELRDFEKHPAKIVVKAVTYHQLRIFWGEDEWIAEIYVDV